MSRWFRSSLVSLLLLVVGAVSSASWSDDVLDPGRLAGLRERASLRLRKIEELIAANDPANRPERVDDQLLGDAPLADWATAVGARRKRLESLIDTIEKGATLPDESEVRSQLDAARIPLEAEQGRAGAPEDPGAVLTEEELAPYEERARKARAESEAADQALQALTSRIKTLEAEKDGFEDREAQARTESSSTDETPLADYRRESADLLKRLVRERRAYVDRALPVWRQLVKAREHDKERAQLVLVRETALLGVARERRQAAIDADTRRRDAEAAQKRLDAEREKDPLERAVRDLEADVSATLAATSREKGALAKLSTRLETQLRIRDRWKSERERLDERLAGGGARSRRTAQFLLRTKKLVGEELAVLRKRIFPQLDDEIDAHQGTRIDCQDGIYALEADSPERIAAWDELAARLPEDRHEEALARLAPARTKLREALEERRNQLDEILIGLGKINAAVTGRRDELVALDTLVISRIYWIRSDPPIDGDTLTGIVEEMGALAVVYAGARTIGEISRGYEESRTVYLLVAAGMLGLVIAGGLVNLRVSRYRRRWNYRGSALLVVVQRLAASVLMSALAPACLALAAVVLSASTLPDVFVTPGQHLLIGLAVVLFARRFLWAMFRAEGIAPVEMATPPAVSAQLLRASRWATAMAMLLILPTWILGEEPLALTHIPRVLFALSLLTGASILIGLVGRRRPLMLAATGGHGFWHRVTLFVSPVVGAGLLGIVLMDVLGYRFGARLLMGNVLETFVAVLVLVGLYNLLTRIIEGAVERVLRRRRIAGDSEPAEATRLVLRRLTRFAGVLVVVAAVALLMRFWGIGEQLQRFSESVEILEIDADAGTILTLWNVLCALGWIVACHFLLRHAPALYEVLLFPRMARADAGTRFVLITFTRYALIVIAYSAALITLHVSFASLGWLLAAASIGIGFGLQEIIANFVSGLILLVERPVRVGDLIRVGDTVGRVVRINIRATVVESEDLEVLIIPNRELITQQVTNWTHNDEIIRRQVSVGIAYGADVETAVRVMLEAAKANPKVRRDPAPTVLFTGFGDSSLDFVLHVFLRAEERNPVRSDLHKEINRRFAEAGIPIPFPQRDVWMRTAGG